jgi:RNA polymerase sigma-70 factor, ECF subfamily
LRNPSEQNGSPSTEANGQDKQGDVLLVLAACSGDAHAFVELSKPHSKRILLTLYRITNNWHDAEDALQEALMKAFLHLDSFHGKASFSTWFTSIAVNTALMLLRKRRGVLKIAIDNAGEVGTCSELDFKDTRENPEQCFERQQRADLIQSAIQRLPSALRKVVVLRYSGDLSIKEIALSLGISQAATKSRLLRARIMLRGFVQLESGKLPTSAEPMWGKQTTFPKSSDGDIKASPTRRQSKNGSSSDLIEHNLDSVKVMTSMWNKTIHLSDAELSPVGGR